MILTPLQKLPNNVGDSGKIIVPTCFEWLPKVQKIAQSGHTPRRPLFLNNTPTLVAFTGVTNAHGASSKPAAACRPPLCSLSTATGSNQALGKV